MSKKRGKYLLIGTIFGFIIGLLFAPKKGKELRKNIKEKVEEVKENPKETINETITNIKEKVSDFIDVDYVDSDIKISEDEIIISKTFENEDGEI